MTIRVINDHSVDVPDDMEVDLNNYGPGACDYIMYRKVAIATFETDEPAGAAYPGPFAVMYDDSYGSIDEVPTLDAARALIDDYILAST